VLLCIADIRTESYYTYPARWPWRDIQLFYYWCVAVRCCELQCVAVSCSALLCVECVAVSCSALLFVAVHCCALQCVAEIIISCNIYTLPDGSGESPNFQITSVFAWMWA